MYQHDISATTMLIVLGIEAVIGIGLVIGLVQRFRTFKRTWGVYPWQE